MMVDLLDAVDWTVLVPMSGPVACYRDGRISQWRPEGVAALRSRIAVNITVLADAAWEVFDSEAGNAGVDAVAISVSARLGLRLWSIVYVNKDLHDRQTAALLAQGVHWTDARFWPEPGCYLWAADPDVPPGTVPDWCPVPPVAVQDRALDTHDISTCYPPFPHPPSPISHAPKERAVIYRNTQNGACLAVDGAYRFPVLDPDDLAAATAAGVVVWEVDPAQYAVVAKAVGLPGPTP